MWNKLDLIFPSQLFRVSNILYFIVAQFRNDMHLFYFYLDKFNKIVPDFVPICLDRIPWDFQGILVRILKILYKINSKTKCWLKVQGWILEKM